MWVKWIHAYKLKHRSFWDVPLVSSISWGWRKLLQMRNLIRPHVWYKLGNGTTASIWFDTWDNRRGKVADVVNEGAWSWLMT
ncbi:hypothetical protein Tco_0460294, partial [Tanacetum coccineum]